VDEKRWTTLLTAASGLGENATETGVLAEIWSGRILDISENEPKTLMQQDADINCRRCLLHLWAGIMHHGGVDSSGESTSTRGSRAKGRILICSLLNLKSKIQNLKLLDLVGGGLVCWRYFLANTPIALRTLILLPFICLIFREHSGQSIFYLFWLLLLKPLLILKLRIAGGKVDKSSLSRGFHWFYWLNPNVHLNVEADLENSRS